MNQINCPLTTLLGDSPQNQVLSFFFEHRDSDFTKTELAKYTHLSRQSIYNALEPLLRFDMVLESRKIANSTLYRLNVDSKSVKALCSFNEAINTDVHRFEYDRKKIESILEKRKDMLIILS